MSEKREEIRRTRTKDPEMDAMAVLIQAFEPLSEAARRRVMEWARGRFIDEPTRSISDEAFAAMKAQLDAITKRAKELGVDDRKLVHALSAVREREGLAPIEVREQIERAEQEAVDAKT